MQKLDVIELLNQAGEANINQICLQINVKFKMC